MAGAESSMQLHRAQERGRSRLDWLDSAHSFSFGAYRNAARMGWGPLRVLNDDRVAPGAGFGPHGHRDMEILTWVLSGELEHRDDRGGHARLPAGTFQRMRAGRGIVHSEMNASATERVRFLQIWLEPRVLGLAPDHREWRPATGGEAAEKKKEEEEVRLIASGRSSDAPLDLAADAEVVHLRLAAGRARTVLEGMPSRRGYLHLVRGALEARGADAHVSLAPGDALAWQGHGVELTAAADSEALLFDLA